MVTNIDWTTVDGEITGNMIASGAITSDKIASGAVNWGKLANWSYRRNSVYNTSDFAYADMAAIGFAWGTISITPSAAGTPTSATLTFPITFSAAPCVTCTVNQGSSTATNQVTVASVGTTTCKIWLTRSNTTDTKIFWMAIGSVT